MQIFLLTIMQFCFIAASLLGAASITCDALASHLPSYYFIKDGSQHLHIAAIIALFHSIILLLLCFNLYLLPPIRTALLCLAFVTGTLFFSPSVGLHAFGIIQHAPLAPIGGSLLILSWIGLLSLLPAISTKMKSHLFKKKQP